MPRFLYRLAMPLVAAVLCSNALAHEVTLKNGDRLSGKIVERTEEAVTIETEYAGRVKINASHIKEIVEIVEEAEGNGPAESAEQVKTAVEMPAAEPAIARKPLRR